MDERETERKQTASELIRSFRQMRNMNWTGLKASDGYTKSEVMMLFHVQRCTHNDHEGPKSSDLARSLNVAMPTVTQMVNVLEARGLLERRRDPEDRRAVRIQLTPEGEQMTLRAKATMLESIGRVVDHLGMERSRQLVALLDDVFGFYAENDALACSPDGGEPSASGPAHANDDSDA